MVKIGNIGGLSPEVITVDLLEIEDGHSASRMADGSMIKDIIATKRLLELEWKALLWNDLSRLMQVMSKPFFNVTYPDSVSGLMETRTFFVTQRSSPVAFEKNGEYYWQGVSVNLEEK